MFYIKHLGKKVYIEDGEDGNVFTTCPVCGKEFHAALSESVHDGKLDIYSTRQYCSDCSKQSAEGLEAE